MKIAAGATILGLGGLAGYAVTSNGAQDASVPTTAAHLKPKVHTQVVRRTIHVRPHPERGAGAAGSSPGGSSAAPSSAPAPVMASAPPSPTPSATPASPSSNQPISTHTSGGGGGQGGGYDDDEGERDDGGEQGDD